MLKFKGAIFDVDDTILDNKHDKVGNSLHERSRLQAVHVIGREENLPVLSRVTEQESLDAFLTASDHSTVATVWNLLRMKNLVVGDLVEEDNDLMRKIIRLKNELHEKLLIEEGEEVPGATAFIEALAANGLEGKLAVASSAIRHEINVFFSKTGLNRHFPDDKIKSKEDVVHTKPHPEVFNLAFEALGLTDQERGLVIVFEDDPRGIMAGVAAGLKVCAITTRYEKKFLQKLEIPPHFIIENYAEAYKIVGIDR